MTVIDYADDQVVLANTAVKAKSILRSLEQAAEGIDLFVNTNKTEFICFICFKQEGAISTFSGKPLK